MRDFCGDHHNNIQIKYDGDLGNLDDPQLLSFLATPLNLTEVSTIL